MIETDEQRRWWFATHPEYSWSNKGGKNREEGQEEADSDKVRPEDVDAYVDEALKYVDGPVADLLKSVRRNFGTEGDLQRGGQNQSIWPDDSAWVGLIEYHVDGGAFMPRLPTTEELSRWPKELASKFVRWLNALAGNNPLIIDPDALEGHHRLIKELREYFMDCGLDIDDYMRIMRAADHRYLPDGLHTGKGRGGRWNEEWRQFKEKYPAQNTDEQRERILKHLDELEKKYGSADKGHLSPPRRKRK